MMSLISPMTSLIWPCISLISPMTSFIQPFKVGEIRDIPNWYHLFRHWCHLFGHRYYEYGHWGNECSQHKFYIFTDITYMAIQRWRNEWHQWPNKWYQWRNKWHQWLNKWYQWRNTWHQRADKWHQWRNKWYHFGISRISPTKNGHISDIPCHEFGQGAYRDMIQ